MKTDRDNKPSAPARRPAGLAEIVVVRGNPSRGRGYEIAHFSVGKTGALHSLFQRDIFMNTLTAAAKWVLRHYPTAQLRHGRKNRRGRLAALRFTCELSDLLRAPEAIPNRREFQD